MKLYIRVALVLLCAALIVSMPFFLSSPALLQEAESGILYGDDEGSAMDFGRLLVSSAYAEEAGTDGEFSAEEINISELGKLSIPDEWALPLDFSVPPEPDPECYTENGYEDQSIRVRVETRNMLDSIVQIAYVEIASPTQLRTVVEKRDKKVSKLADANNAVIAMNGDYCKKDSNNKFFEIRMTKKQNVAKKNSKSFDTLVIDKNGDFHVFVLSDGLTEYREKHMNDIVNAFLFGPALVKDGEIVFPEGKKYLLYASEHCDGRSAIGQTGPLSYVMVVVEAHGKDSKGVTFAGLAQIMKELGCITAYNLDGGNSAELYMKGPEPDLVKYMFKGNLTAAEREQSDIIYFATAVPVDQRK